MGSVSVVIPTYNRAQLLPQTLASVLAALEGDDEIVVVDDGSSDDTEAVVLATGAPWRSRTRFIPLPHAGAGHAFNAGIAAARHDLVAFADSDDLWLPYRLALQRPVLRDEPRLAYCFTNFSHVEDGPVEPHWLVRWSGDPRPWDEILAPGLRYADRWPLPATLPVEERGFRVHVGSMHLNQLRANYMSVNTLLVRRSLVGERLGFGVDLPRLADWECYARVSAAGDGAFLDVDTAVQRAHSGPRLCHQGRLPFLLSRVAIIERTWARDEAFMARHAREVHALLARLRREALRRLIRENRRAEARALVDRVPHAWLERAALTVPPAVLGAMLALIDSRE